MEPLDVKTGSRSVMRRSRLWVVPQLIMPILVLAGAVFVMRDMIASKPEVRQRAPRERIYTVDTATVISADHQPVFSVYGNVVAAKSVDLRVLVAGEIQRVSPNLRVGATVEKGDALIEIDKFNYLGAVTEARANLAEAKARLSESRARKAQENNTLDRAIEQHDIAKKDLKRAKSLLAKGNITERSIDDRRLIASQRQQAVEQRRNNLLIEDARIVQYQTAIKRLDWRLAQAKKNLENTVLIAPFAGVVLSENAEPGRLLNANDMAVRLYDWKSLEAKFTLSDLQYGRIAGDASGLVGRQVSVSWAVGDEPIRFAAKIDRVGAEIASLRGGVDVYARIVPKSSGIQLRPGAFVRIEVPDKLIAKSIRLPESAVYADDHVFVVVKGRLRRRTVKVLAYLAGDVVVSGELADGDQVLTTRIAEAGNGLGVRREGDAPRRPGKRGKKKPQISKPKGNGDGRKGA